MRVRIIIFNETADPVALERVYERMEAVPQHLRHVGLFIPGQKRVIGMVRDVIYWPNGDMPDVFVRVSPKAMRHFAKFDPENWRPPTEQHILEHLQKEFI